MQNLLWDLDGTLTDPVEGITKSIQYALHEHGHPAPAAAELLWCIGPPLHRSFLKLVPGATEEQIWRYVAKYRERFSTVGLFENMVYPGVRELLESLGNHRHFVATAKPRIFATRIIDHFRLGTHFREVYGSELDGTRTDKGELIQFILQKEKIPRHAALMIGEELLTAGAEKICQTPAELRDYLSDQP